MSEDEMSLRQKFEFIRRDYDEWPGELIAQALDEIDRLRGNEARVRGLHRDGGMSQGFYDDRGYGEREHACTECGSHGEYGVEWPCPTLRALDGERP